MYLKIFHIEFIERSQSNFISSTFSLFSLISIKSKIIWVSYKILSCFIIINQVNKIFINLLFFILTRFDYFSLIGYSKVKHGNCQVMEKKLIIAIRWI